MNRQQRRQEIRSVRRAERRGNSLGLGPSTVDLLQQGLGDFQAGRLLQAEAAYRQILTIDPAHAVAHNNLGAALYALGRPAEAEASYREALRLRPNYPEAHNNLGNALNDLGRAVAAEASYREALRFWPNHPEIHKNLGHALLLAGRFEEGWKEYEWRWKFSSSARDFSAPLWRGRQSGIAPSCYMPSRALATRYSSAATHR